MKNRKKKANLLSYKTYAEYGLATRMVKTSQAALSFLQQIADACGAKAKQELEVLQAFAKKNLNLETMQSWDLLFVSEKIRQHDFDFSQESLKPYFSLPTVLLGMSQILKKLWNIELKLITGVDVWHPDVLCYALYDEHDQLRSYLYLDLFTRENKRSGAWMDGARVRRRQADGEIQLPISFIVANFSPPIEDHPPLLTHQEIVTFFHEMGHALQYMLTQMEYADVSGINGIPWDAVEMPSQFFENWAWEKESLDLFAKHYQTFEPLPDNLFAKMQQARHFNAAIMLLRQLEFGLFDMRLYTEFDEQHPDQIQKIIDEIRSQVTLIPVPSYNRFQHGFAHIFAGGYAAGYYSYLWAEVMACDAFSLFQEKGIFNQEIAKQFLVCFLEPGGSEDPAVLFKKFRGREPKIYALLEYLAIV